MMSRGVDSERVSLRAWHEADLESLVREANSRAVWRNLTHAFPHPYTASDAARWIEGCSAEDPARNFVVAVDDRLVGGCGVTIGCGVSAYTGSIGYWLGEAHWDRGIMSNAISRLLAHVWDTFSVERLQAEVFAWNPASARILEKHGFTREGTRRRAIHKDGQFVDEWFYSLLRPEAA